MGTYILYVCTSWKYYTCRESPATQQIIVLLVMALKTVYKHFGIFLGAEVCCIALEIPVFAEDRCLDMQKGTIYLSSFLKD